MFWSYRLAPEFPFPQPIEDCYSATLGFLENRAEYPVNIDLEKIIFAGDSAGTINYLKNYDWHFSTIKIFPGAIIATVLSNRFSAEKKFVPNLQLLVYPPTQYFNFAMPSTIAHSYLDQPFTRAKMSLLYMGINLITEEHEAFLNNNLHTLLITDPELKERFKKCLDISLIPEEYRQNRFYYDSYKEVENLVYPSDKESAESISDIKSIDDATESIKETERSRENIIEAKKSNNEIVEMLNDNKESEDDKVFEEKNENKEEKGELLSESESQAISLYDQKSPLFKDEKFVRLMRNMVDVRYSPGLMDDEQLKNQAKTLMIVCEFDTRKDEALIYAERLRLAGNSVKVCFYPNGYHGVFRTQLKIGIQMRNDLVEFVKENL